MATLVLADSRSRRLSFSLFKWRYQFWAKTQGLAENGDGSDVDSDDERTVGPKHKTRAATVPRKRQRSAAVPPAQPPSAPLPAPAPAPNPVPAPAYAPPAPAPNPVPAPAPTLPAAPAPAPAPNAASASGSAPIITEEPDLFAGIDVSPPAPPPVTTTIPATAPVVSKDGAKEASPSSTTFTARNLCLAVWCAEVGGSVTSFNVYWDGIKKDKKLSQTLRVHRADFSHASVTERAVMRNVKYMI
ncbi:hypothetical protein K438DRAFT_1973412 [Mycena galopus ATCC 62051]|nr:hypothetical protein K438DRAFT_1973412 [Mycena galopus ATCC 62051]